LQLKVVNGSKIKLNGYFVSVNSNITMGGSLCDIEQDLPG